MQDKSRVMLTVRMTPKERRRVNQLVRRLSAVSGMHISTNVFCRDVLLEMVDLLEGELDGKPPPTGEVPSPPRSPIVQAADSAL